MLPVHEDCSGCLLGGFTGSTRAPNVTDVTGPQQLMVLSFNELKIWHLFSLKTDLWWKTNASGARRNPRPAPEVLFN